MKRDWKLIRRILTGIETESRTLLEREPHSAHSIEYKHCMLLMNARYIELRKQEDNNYYMLLTWQGHDLLEYLGNGLVIEELTEMGYPITDYTLEKYAEFLMGRDLLDEEDSEFVD